MSEQKTEANVGKALRQLRYIREQALELPRMRAEWVQTLREAGWTYERIGQAVGVSRQRVWEWEHHYQKEQT